MLRVYISHFLANPNLLKSIYWMNKCSLVIIFWKILDGSSLEEMCCTYVYIVVSNISCWVCDLYLFFFMILWISCCSLSSFFMGVQEVELPQIIEDSLILSSTESSYLIRLLLQPLSLSRSILTTPTVLTNNYFLVPSEVPGKVLHMLAWKKTPHGISLVTLRSSGSTWKFQNGRFVCDF